MSLLSKLQPGVHLYDRRTGHERLVQAVEPYDQVVFLSFKQPQTGTVDRQPFSLAELESRFELLSAEAVAYRASPEIVTLVAEAHRLEHAYLFNPLFTTETSPIDLLPHQPAAVYGVPSTSEEPDGQPGLLDHPRLRFLLADDAGAGKTIMAGLVIREMLLRRLVKRVLIVPPAGLVGNWDRELRNLFRLLFASSPALMLSMATLSPTRTATCPSSRTFSVPRGGRRSVSSGWLLNSGRPLRTN